jgi:hypothetical protein
MKGAAMSDEINDFLKGSSGKAFEFGAIGDTVKGVIVDMKKRQQTDFQTGAPAFWSNGEPRMMLMVTLQTELQDDADDEGLRNVYLRGGNFTALKGKGTASLVAVKDAVKRSGKPIEVGGTLTLQFSGEGPAPAKGMNPAKLYVASYQPPAYAVELDELA